MKKLLVGAFVSVISFAMYAQNPALKGNVIDSKNFSPLQNVSLTIEGTSYSEISANDGSFAFQVLPENNSILVVSYTGYKTQRLPIEPSNGETVDLGVISLEEDITSEAQLSLITITENDLGDENTGSESTSGLLQASRHLPTSCCF